MTHVKQVRLVQDNRWLMTFIDADLAHDGWKLEVQRYKDGPLEPNWTVTWSTGTRWPNWIGDDKRPVFRSIPARRMAVP